MKLGYSVLILAIVFSIPSYGQLYMNEFMASNASTIKDPVFNDDADWIELYNDGNAAINLNGYSLTDNFTTPGKWKIGNITIPAKGYTLFWADGKNTGNHTSFKLDALVEEIGLYGPDLSVIDTISYADQQTDISMGRNKNDLQQWGYFILPTPNSINSTEFFTGFALNAPEFAIRGGIYQSGFSLHLFTDLGGEIRYTLDGSDPVINSPLFTLAIPIEKTTVVRARIFKPSIIPGPIVTNSYFINENMDARGLPVVSLATNPGNFWDAQKGIYVQNFKPDWEVPVNIELFENNGADRAAFNEMAGIKINGLYSWQLPQKMLGVYFKKQYGTGTLDNTLFYDSPRSGFKTFALRASGNDWSNTLMRDILGQNATQLNMKLDISAFRWCVVYVNGQYMGIHNFREKIETDYIEKHYGLAAGTFDIVENEDYAECGDLIAYNQLKTLFSRNLAVQSNFDALAAKMDIVEFTDLVIAEMASGNFSIDHNVMAWKPKESGKWRWILMDLDRGYYDVNGSLIDFYIGQSSFPFGRLMTNPAYKTYFGKRLADHLYTSFNPLAMKKLIDSHQATIAPEMDRHVARWLGTTSSYGNAMPSVDYWNNEVSKVVAFVQQRPQVLLNDLRNYGFNGIANLTLSMYPDNAGTLIFNGLKIPQPNWTGLYLKNLNSEIAIEEKAGFIFKGWVNPVQKVIIPKLSVWKYLDNGSDQGTNWHSKDFNDNAWKSGQGELGYGDGNEKTIIGFGTNSQNKFITTYFRHTFTLTEADKSGSDYKINLLVDDGAIVYLNGVELFRDNITSGIVGYNTLASTAIGGTAESEYNSFSINRSILVTGDNVLAVEVHQSSANSTDISFDLEMSCSSPDNQGYVSTLKNYPFSLTGDLSLIAVFEATGQCLVPSVIAGNDTLFKSCSPYIAQSDVTINSGATLTIEPGVEIWMSPATNFYIHGNINALGAADDRIIFKINPQYEPEGWGSLNFWNTSGTSNLSYITISDATRSPIPIRLGAISGYYTTLNLDNILIDKTHLNPISTRYSDVTLTNSFIQSHVTSDLINIKYGKARIENCTFVGNAEFDSDGIDYDGIENGVIRNTRIYNILGNNADAIDIGEEAARVIIDSVFIFNAFDKGVSVGQRSSVLLTNSTLVNCNLGLGIKDSSRAIINGCTFYGNGSAVSCYEKNIGRAGGNAVVKNSILSNASLATFEYDDKSTILFRNCLSDNDLLPSDPSNILSNPMFTNPTHFDFSLLPASPAILSGYQNEQPVNMGSKLRNIGFEPDLMICQIYIDPLNSGNPEFIALYNPSSKTMDLSGYMIDKGVTCLVPTGTLLSSGDTLFVTADVSKWKSGRQVIQWTEGKLSNDGEAIELLNQYGMVADFVRYSLKDGWPAGGFATESILTLMESKLDNHLAENWITIPSGVILSTGEQHKSYGIRIYPNPATDHITITTPDDSNITIEMYSPIGQIVFSSRLNGSGTLNIDVSDFEKGIYLIKVGTWTEKVLIIR
jgi:hypothetical protein